VLKELISVPRLKQRLAALESKHQFPSFVRDIQSKVNKIRMASMEIAQSAEFKTILLVVLQVGNKMNYGTNRGSAKGFRLIDLTKLAQLKSVDKSVTLLHYVARMIRVKKGNVVRLGDSLVSLYDVQSIAIPELQGDMNRISDITENINVELAAQRLKNRIEVKEESDKFVEVMTEFVDTASKLVDTAKLELDETMRLMRDTMMRFDKDSESDEAPAPVDGAITPAVLASAGGFFSMIYEFSTALMKADRENEQKRIRDEKRLKQQELKCATPRSKSAKDVLDRSSGVKASEPQTQEALRVKSPVAGSSNAPSRSASTSSLPRVPSNNAPVPSAAVQASSTEPAPSTATVASSTSKSLEGGAESSKLKKPLPVSALKPPQHTPSLNSSTSKCDEAQPPQTTTAAAKPKPKATLKVPGKIVKTSAQSSASPLKKLVGVAPTEAVASPGKLPSVPLTGTSMLSSVVMESPQPFDASSISEIRSQLETKHATNNEPQQTRKLKPEVETDTEDHDNNNSEPASPEKAFVEFMATATDSSPFENAMPSVLRGDSRRLAVSSGTTALSAFRAIPTKGMRGFLEGGVFSSSSPLACAQLCVADPLCLSFDFETLSLDCYISYTDRYAHPEAFLNFPTGIYYEWQGVVDAPELEPSGGLFHTQIAVRLLTAKLGAEIHYRVLPLAEITGADLTASDLFGSGQSYSTVANGDVIVLPTYSCQLFAIAVKEGMDDSDLVVSEEYQIFASKYAFLVPYFNGEFHGSVTRIQLDLKGKKRPRPARFLEFSDYETPNGIGPYDAQVAVINLTTLSADFKGFHGGFTAFSKTSFVNETYLVPALDDPNYQRTVWQIVLEAQYTPSATHSGFGTPAELQQDAEYLYLVPFFNGVSYASSVIRVLASTFSSMSPIVETLSLASVSANLKGFGASFTDDSYGYLVPRENENGLFGTLVRFPLENFVPESVEVLDLAAVNPRFVGFSSAFTYGNFAFLVPFRRPLEGDELTQNLREFPVSNSGLVVRRVKESASQELNPYSGLIARVDLRDFTSVSFLDLTAIHSELRGFMRGFAYRQYVILVPHRSEFYRVNGQSQSGKVVRIDTTGFSASGVSYLDLTAALRSQVPDFADHDLRGFNGGVVSGKYGLFVPYFNGATFSGKVCRINLDKFEEVQTLDLTQLDGALRGFADGILSKVQYSLDTDLFGEFQIRLGTTTPYDYTY
ncbi:hypothetical protein BBJ28_00022455, partial [Nothophytophthora sp. Chile5]